MYSCTVLVEINFLIDIKEIVRLGNSAYRNMFYAFAFPF